MDDEKLYQNEQVSPECASEPPPADGEPAKEAEEPVGRQEENPDVEDPAPDAEKEPQPSEAPAPEPPEQPEPPAAERPEAPDLKELLSQETEALRRTVARSAERVDVVAATEQKVLNEVREMHKLYHNEFAGRLKNMQAELEEYRKVDKGRAFDDILGAIARIYGNNETLEEEVAEPKAKKGVRYLLLDLADLLEAYGVGMQKSKPGDKRNPRFCQVLERIPTADRALHDTVVLSHNTGFYIENRPIIKERVDIYLFRENAQEAEAPAEEKTEAAESEPEA